MVPTEVGPHAGGNAQNAFGPAGGFGAAFQRIQAAFEHLSGMLGFLGQPDDPAGEVMNGLVFEIHAHRRSTPSVAVPELHLQRNRWPSFTLADGHGPSAVFAEVTVDTSEQVVERWGTDILTAAEDHLRGRIQDLPQLAVPVRGALLELHPGAEGALNAPEATALAKEQLTVLARVVSLLGDK
ncbi:hypothetical protein AB0K18_45895 [Nonomuraea sp. NPDC049421]|uniref:hypothetical protein n=1 Tax=Nonomuraea sp. NPDC049421 TaxID=3155275 RepID=UPI0034472BF0